MPHPRTLQLPADIRREYPFNGQTFRLNNGATMHYLDEGKGPVVLMLHGNPTWSFYYRNLLKELSGKNFRCIVPDHIGCGLSDKPKEYSYTLKQRIEDIESLVDHLRIDSFSLVGHDWGGAIACGIAGRRHQALQKLVLLNTAAFRNKRIPARIAFIKIPILGEWIVRALNGFAGPAIHMCVQSPLKKPIRRGFLRPYRTWADRIAVWNFVKDIPLNRWHPSYTTLTEVESNLSKIAHKPIQLIWGAKDFCFTMHFHDRFKRFFPTAKSAVYEHCGHYVLEDGGPKVWSEIRSFLSQ